LDRISARSQRTDESENKIYDFAFAPTEKIKASKRVLSNFLNWKNKKQTNPPPPIMASEAGKTNGIKPAVLGAKNNPNPQQQSHSRASPIHPSTSALNHQDVEEEKKETNESQEEPFVTVSRKKGKNVKKTKKKGGKVSNKDSTSPPQTKSLPKSNVDQAILSVQLGLNKGEQISHNFLQPQRPSKRSFKLTNKRTQSSDDDEDDDEGMDFACPSCKTDTGSGANKSYCFSCRKAAHPQCLFDPTGKGQPVCKKWSPPLPVCDDSENGTNPNARRLRVPPPTPSPSPLLTQ
jgi:hypothetical protein